MSIIRVCAIAAFAIGCGRGASPPPEPAPAPLASLAAQRLIVVPAGFVRADTSAFGRQGAASARALDTAIAGVLGERGLSQQWIMPPALVAAFERNRTYAADPHRLALQQLRSAQLAPQARVTEPLSSQLRTMVALHEDARLVLVPVELRFEPGAGATARGVLKVALVDPRFAQVNWVGTVEGSAAATPALAMRSVAEKLADLFLAP